MSANMRSSHPSSRQMEALLDFLERNPDLAKGFLKNQSARERCRRLWEEISSRVNSMGGTIKTYKQWTKYWSDKKSAIKKKVAAIAAARRRTGGGVEDVTELSEVEERIVALCGGAGFGTGDAHLGIHIFPENVQSETLPSPQIEIENICPSNAPNRAQQHSSMLEGASDDNGILILPTTTNRRTARRLFVSSEDIFASEPSQAVPPSPPPPTLSHTPSPLSMPIASPSRRGATANNTSRIVRVSEGVGSSSSCHVQPPTPRQSATPVLASEASPSRRSATVSNSSRSAAFTNTSRSVRRSAASSSRNTRPVATPPSQRRTEFSTTTERFLRIEEKQLEIQQSNARALQAMVEQSFDRDRVLAEAVAKVGEGLKLLAEAIRGSQHVSDA